MTAKTTTRTPGLDDIRRGDILVLPPSLTMSAKSCRDHGMSVGATNRSVNDVDRAVEVFGSPKTRYLVVTDARYRVPPVDPTMFLGNRPTAVATPKKELTSATVVEVKGEDLGMGPDSVPAASLYAEDPSFLKRKFAEDLSTANWLFVDVAPDRETEAADWAVLHVLDGVPRDYGLNGWVPALVGRAEEPESAVSAVARTRDCRVRDYGKGLYVDDMARFTAPAEFFRHLVRRGARIARIEPANPHALDDALAAARLAMAAEASRITAAKLREFEAALRGAIKLTDRRAAAWAALARTAAAKSRWAREAAAIKEKEKEDDNDAD